MSHALICLHAQLIITRDFTRFRLKKDMLCDTIAVFVSLHLSPPQPHVGGREIRRDGALILPVSNDRQDLQGTIRRSIKRTGLVVACGIFKSKTTRYLKQSLGPGLKSSGGPACTEVGGEGAEGAEL